MPEEKIEFVATKPFVPAEVKQLHYRMRVLEGAVDIVDKQRDHWIEERKKRDAQLRGVTCYILQWLPHPTASCRLALPARSPTRTYTRTGAWALD
ncbi:hypothetical protein ACIQUS_15700 [Pseudomonas sp. NPDC090755]|uniref:hypothetical protein n=1 Tax=Pseudomonas sp. NPDC090755 TaxID=3364481 RepID=UPI00383B28AE